jgi:hypothetical protein
MRRTLWMMPKEPCPDCISDDAREGVGGCITDLLQDLVLGLGVCHGRQ